MKKNMMSFVMVIIILTFMVSIGCSEKKTEKSSEESSIVIKKMSDSRKRSVKSKIDLLCLKYNVESEMLKNDLVESLDTDVFELLLQDTKNRKNNDKKIMETTKETSYQEIIDTEKLISMSKKYNVPISKISGIVYDYIIWDELKEIKNRSYPLYEE